MANKKNLIPAAHPLTVEEASKGGKKSGEVRRAKADLRKSLETELSGDAGGMITADALAKKLVAIGLDDGRKDQLEALKYIFTLMGAGRSAEELAKIKADTKLINAKIKAIQSEQWEDYKTIE